MKGNEKLITVLNTLLVDELTAIYQYMVYYGMCANQGYSKLQMAIRNTKCTDYANGHGEVSG